MRRAAGAGQPIEIEIYQEPPHTISNEIEIVSTYLHRPADAGSASVSYEGQKCVERRGRLSLASTPGQLVPCGPFAAPAQRLSQRHEAERRGEADAQHASISVAVRRHQGSSLRVPPLGRGPVRKRIIAMMGGACRERGFDCLAVQ